MTGARGRPQYRTTIKESGGVLVAEVYESSESGTRMLASVACATAPAAVMREVLGQILADLIARLVPVAVDNSL